MATCAGKACSPRVMPWVPCRHVHRAMVRMTAPTPFGEGRCRQRQDPERTGATPLGTRGFDRYVVFGDDCAVTDHSTLPPTWAD